MVRLLPLLLVLLARATAYACAKQLLPACQEERPQGPLDFGVELCELGPPNQCDLEKEKKDYDPNRVVTKPGSCPVYYADGRRDDTCIGERDDDNA